LVWDQDEETAIQSPQGGTKLTWGGPPLAPKQERNRLRFLLAVDGHIENAAERLVARGATRPSVALAGPGLELADPDGNEFELLPAASLSTS
jgi:hypothetical protein